MASSDQTAETGLSVSLGVMLCVSDLDVASPQRELSHRREGSGTANHTGQSLFKCSGGAECCGG